MNEQRNNGRGIFYGVIGVSTLVVAIIGATFAYFTATAANNSITGSMASVQLALEVSKVTTVDETKGGMIPMSNGMVEAAVSNLSSQGACVDNNGNAVCQVYEIILTNDSSAGQFVDGYVALKGGSGAPTDYTSYTEDTEAKTTAIFPVDGFATGTGEKVGTTMRWAQVFVTGTEQKLVGDADGNGECSPEETEDGCKTVTVPNKFSTGGRQVLGADSEAVNFGTIDNKADGANKSNIRTTNDFMTKITGDAGDDGVCAEEEECEVVTNNKAILKSLSISGTPYEVIGTNYIRVSDHQWETDPLVLESYNRDEDATSALVFSHSIKAHDVGKYYIVVWLSETGENQTAGGKYNDTTSLPGKEKFFMGNVTFISAEGSEVSATFANHARVESVG